ncbi:hypothetical protein [Bacillus sp. JJ722]|uniref:hypothetical protein n=1 Tax=Bacillus sp. JJ722 TaxID=3122973 RepID=UPI002FFDBE07
MNKFNNANLDWITKTDVVSDLALGNDLDSLISCNLLQHITGGKWDINYFYDFHDFYKHEKTGNIFIGVDMAFTKNVRTFDNHLTDRSNKVSINYNHIKGLTRSDYCKKYPFSTLMTIMNVYNIPLPKTTEGKSILLAIDSSFKGHYTTNSYFKSIHTNWLKELGFEELIRLLDQKDSKYFYKIIDYFKLNSPISINEEGKLETDIKLDLLNNYLDWKIELPQQQFNHVKGCVREGHKIGVKKLPPLDKLISLAYTAKNYISYTYKEA